MIPASSVSISKLASMKKVLEDDGVVIIDHDDAFFSNEEWDLLELCSNSPEFPYEKVVVGDAGEPNLVEVGRLMTDIERPLIVNESISKKMLEVLGSSKRMSFYENLLDEESLTLRRAQVNKMHRFSFIGLHVDQDSNPDYKIAIVLQLGSEFSGGDFVVERPGGGWVATKPNYRSVTISRCDFPHQVLPVKSGVRSSLVYFVSPEAGDNPRLASDGAVSG